MSRAGILNQGQGGVAEKTRSAAERTAKATRELAQEAKKPKPARVA
jgi:hypothetical protein